MIDRWNDQLKKVTLILPDMIDQLTWSPDGDALMSSLTDRPKATRSDGGHRNRLMGYQ